MTLSASPTNASGRQASPHLVVRNGGSNDGVGANNCSCANSCQSGATENLRSREEYGSGANLYGLHIRTSVWTKSIESANGYLMIYGNVSTR